jgi:hypothetical protein
MTRIHADIVIRCPQKGDTMLYSEMTDKIINYLKATNKQVGLLFNFCKKPDFKRAIFSNERRGISETEASNPCESAQSASSVFYSSG